MSAENPRQTITRVVSEFLDVLPEPVRNVVYLSAIPNAIHPELLQKMTGRKVNASELLENLQEYYLINKGEGGWFFYSAEVHAILRAFWKQPGNQPKFQRTNQVALTYFENLAKQTSPPGEYVYEREALYHRLLQDEADGLEYMADVFEHACDQRQIGVAQNFNLQLIETLPELSPLAGRHASYYEMRLDFLLNRRQGLEERLEALVEDTSDPLLKGRTLILLGQVLLKKYEWKKSIQSLKASLALLEKIKSWRYAARAMLALGDTYMDLVENGGGVQTEGSNDHDRGNEFFAHLIFLPSFLVGWLRRKIWFLPGWLYLSGNYQDWILNYLLQMAADWYRRARHLAQKVGDENTIENTLLGQANIAILQRREAMARRMYSRLAQLHSAQTSSYRFARILYGQGMVSLMGGHAEEACQEFQRALNVFQSFSDEANVGLVSNSLGRTNLQMGDSEAAAASFLRAFQAYREMQDSISQTQVTWELERLVEKKQVSDSMEQQIRKALASVQEKQYLARFPSDLLRRFRALANGIALPLTYLLILLVGINASLTLIVTEYSALLSENAGLSQSDVLFLIVVGILPVFLSFWVFAIVYAAIGQAWVFFAGRISLNSLGEQPDRILLTPEAIMVNSPGLSEPKQLLWKEIKTFVSADYKLWQRPIHLFSRQGIGSGDKYIILDGITSGYEQVSRELRQRLEGLIQQTRADVTFLKHSSTLLVVLFSLLHALLLVWNEQIDITVENMYTGNTYHLFLSRLLVFFILDLFMILPPLFLWRVILQRRFFGQQLGRRPRRLFNLVVLTITILLTIVTLVWLVISPVLKIS